MAFFTELEQIILKIVWKHTKLQIAKTILRKKNKAGGYHAPWFQNTLQTYSYQNGMVLAQKQTHRWMEQNTEPRNEPTLSWPINLQQRRQNIQWGKESLFINNVGKTVQLHAKESNWTTLSHHAQNWKWSKNLNLRPETIKLLEENLGSNLFDLNLSNIFFGYVSSGNWNKSKNKQVGLHQTKKLLHNKGKCQ